MKRRVDFVHIGPGRSGTTFLYRLFRSNDSICLPEIKELNYFNSNYLRGSDWYESRFKNCSAECLTGEISNLYIYDKQVAQRIFDYNQDMKIICVLRNPFEYLKSVYKYRLSSLEINKGTSFQDALTIYPELLVRCDYASLLEPYLRIFDSKQLFISKFENINDEKMHKELFEFLGCDYSVPVKVQKINASKHVRNRALGKVAKVTANFLRQNDALRLLQILKDNDFARSIIYKRRAEVDADDMNYSIEQKDLLNGYIVKMECLLGWDLNDWKE